ncbi:CPBP family glutamic-type intramembrane protease [Streptomyces cucumeris]|uniref:CPBP family glutamic-type intramembrane protease n=1 Tax=Streptomyces cucumeris TaxID=2962890 RepID=UPI003D72A635
MTPSALPARRSDTKGEHRCRRPPPGPRGSPHRHRRPPHRHRPEDRWCSSSCPSRAPGSVPLAFIGYVHFSDVALGLVVWTVMFLCQEVVLAWLYLRSGTVWVASLAHAGNNMVLFLLTGQLLTADDGRGPAHGALVTSMLPTIPVAALALWAGYRLRVRPPQEVPTL